MVFLNTVSKPITSGMSVCSCVAIKMKLSLMVMDSKEHAVVKWLRHYATRHKVAGSSSDEVIESFHFT
jgi:hypothetical protein